MAVSESDRLEIVNRKENIPENLADRITRLEAKEEVLNLQMQYRHFTDAHDWEGVLSLCTDDIERIIGGTLDEELHGKEALREWYRNPSLKRASDGANVPSFAVDKNYHLVFTPVVRISEDGNQAWSTEYYSVVSIKDETSGAVRGANEGASIFTYVKQNGEWKIKKMVLITNLAHNPIWALHYRK
jgi:hypothetical protein